MSERHCEFDRAWIGPCGAPADDAGYCPGHTAVRCCSCGAQATRECDHTGIQFVCGEPLCDGCEHGEVPPDSLFALGGGHRRKVRTEATP